MRVLADPTISAFKFEVLRAAYMRVYTVRCNLTLVGLPTFADKYRDLSIENLFLAVSLLLHHL